MSVDTSRQAFDGAAQGVSARPASRHALARAPLALATVGLLVLTLAAALFFHQLGEASIAGDEAIYAIAAAEAAEEGRWHPLTFWGEPIFSKPPLGIWAEAMVFRLAAVGEASARILAATSGLVTVLAVFAFGSLTFGTTAGCIAALLLLTNPGLLGTHGFRGATLDAPLVALMTVGLCLVLVGRQPGARARTKTWLHGATALLLTAAVLVKGPAALLAGPIVALGTWIGPPRMGLRQALRVTAATCLPALLVLGLWTILMMVQFGEPFLTVLHREIVLRAFDWKEPAQSPGPWFYLVQIVRDFGPWLLLIPLGVISATGGAVPQNQEGRSAPLFLAIWAVIVVLAFSLASGKLSWYVLPAYPPLGLLIGAGAGRLLDLLRRHRIVHRLVVTLTALLLLLPVWKAAEFVNQAPLRLEIDRLQEAVGARLDISACLDRRMLAQPRAVRGWTRFYLRRFQSWHSVGPGQLWRDPALCQYLITDRPQDFVDLELLPPGSTLALTRLSSEEAEAVLVDLTGDAFAAL